MRHGANHRGAFNELAASYYQRPSLTIFCPAPEGSGVNSNAGSNFRAIKNAKNFTSCKHGGGV